MSEQAIEESCGSQITHAKGPVTLPTTAAIPSTVTSRRGSVMRNAILAAVLAVGSFAVVSACGGPAELTPGSGSAPEQLAAPQGLGDRSAAAAVSSVIASGTLPSLERIRKDKSPRDVTLQQLTFAPGDGSAYHYHLGPVFVVVQAGTLTEDDGCGNVETHPAGTAFQEIPGHVHHVANDGTVSVQLYTTSIIPHGQPLSVRVTPPVCKPEHKPSKMDDAAAPADDGE
jgi:quercetin dioxygenase-like cupin family protein